MRIELRLKQIKFSLLYHPGQTDFFHLLFLQVKPVYVYVIGKHKRYVKKYTGDNPSEEMKNKIIVISRIQKIPVYRNNDIGL